MVDTPQQEWWMTLRGMLRAALRRPQPVLSEVKAYLGAIQQEGQNPQPIYEELVANRAELFPNLSPLPTFEEVMSGSGESTARPSQAEPSMMEAPSPDQQVEPPQELP